MDAPRVFVLSPARLDGARGQMLLNPRSQFALARELESQEGAAIGDVFSFLSGLYFRGKLTYANAFADPPEHAPPVLIITTHRGLMTPDERVRRHDLELFSRVDLGRNDQQFLRPLISDATSLEVQLNSAGRVVLLGSIATGKYVDPLLGVFGERLLFPATFVGRGDMSRGGLLLRSVRSGVELDYIPVQGALRHGSRPPKLARLK
jgi:hypothetical protein